MKTGLVIPTYNAATNNDFDLVLKKIIAQSSHLFKIRVYDSESTDDTISILKNNKIEFKIIPKSKFSHSGTRTLIAKEMLEEGIDNLIFMTQDVFLQKNAIKELIDFFEKNNVALAYGKQEVDLNKGNLFEYSARNFNYGEKDLIKNIHDIHDMGIKTIFCSDAFSIYDLRYIEEIGYFGQEANFAEDMIIADKIIFNNGNIGYCSTAKVYHSHNYSIIDEYKRYKEIGWFHAQFDYVLSKYKGTDKEGVKLVISEINYLCSKRKYYLIPLSLIRNFMKFIGMKNGKYRYKKSVKIAN